METIPRKKGPLATERAVERPARALIPSRSRVAGVLPTAAALAALLMACGNPIEPIRADPQPQVRVHKAEPSAEPEEPTPTEEPETTAPSSTPATAPDIELGPVAPPAPPKPVHPPPKVKPIAPRPKPPHIVGDMAAVRPTFGTRTGRA